MAFARQVFTAAGGDPENFTVTFPYLLEAHVVVSRNGTVLTKDTDYLIVSTTTVRFNAATSTNTAGDTIVIQRVTSQDRRLVDYATASTMTEVEFDTDSLQAFYMAQEALDISDLSIGLDETDHFTAEDKRIKDVAAPTDEDDAATKGYVDGISVAAGNVPTPDDPGDDDGLLVASGGTFAWVAQALAPYIAKASTVVQSIVRPDSSTAIGIGFQTDTDVLARLQLNSGASQNLELVKKDSSTPDDEAVAIRLENDKIIFRMDNGTDRLQVDEADAQGELLVRQATKWEGFAVGTSGNTLITKGAAANPEWFPVGQWIAHADNPKTLAGTTTAFASLPADIDEFIVGLNGTSTDGTEETIIQLSVASTFITTGYLSNVSVIAGSTAAEVPFTTGFALTNAGVEAELLYGVLHFYRFAGHVWMCSGNLLGVSSDVSVRTNHVSGFIDLAGAPDGVRLTSTGTPDDFDAGTVSLLYRRNPAG